MKKFLMIIMLISLFGFVGCGKDDDNNNEIPVTPLYSQEEMYTKFKKAYANRKLYSESYTEKTSNVISDQSGDEMATISEVSINAETKEGFVKARSYTKSGTIINDLINSEMHIIKKDNQYLNYYSNKTEVEEYYDVFILEEDADDEIEYGTTEEYITFKNPNQYTTIEKYANSLAKSIKGNDNLIAKDSSFSQNENVYTLAMSFGYEGNDDYKINITIIFDDQTVIEYKFIGESKVQGSSGDSSMNIKESVEYIKSFNSSGMNFDSSRFNNIVAGKEIEVSYKIIEGFLTTSSNVPAKRGQKINDRMLSVAQYYGGQEDKTFDGWYYDKELTNKVGDNDTITGDITIYAKVIVKEYEISSSSGSNGIVNLQSSGVRGETINVSAVANSGYVVSEMYYVKEGENEKHYFVDSFEMPSGDITVYVNFGTKYRISTKEQLLAYLPNNPSKDFVLCADIDLEGMEWDPILYFSGTFDGGGYKIHNFKITEEKSTSGLFGIIENAKVKDLKVSNFDIHYVSGENLVVVGGIAGVVIDSEISNCIVEGVINVIGSNGKAYAGGLAGVINITRIDEQTKGVSTIRNNSVNVTVTIQGRTSTVAGGLTAGVSDATIINNYSIGNVTASGGSEGLVAGGLIGGTAEGNVLIQSNYSIGNVLCKNKQGSEYSSAAGGLIGMADVGTIKNNYATGDITAYNIEGIVAAGGLLAISDDAVIQQDNYRYNNQTISGTSSSYINTEGVSGSMSTIWLFVYNKWDNSVWNLSVSAHPTLK